MNFFNSIYLINSLQSKGAGCDCDQVFSCTVHVVFISHSLAGTGTYSRKYDWASTS